MNPASLPADDAPWDVIQAEAEGLGRAVLPEYDCPVYVVATLPGKLAGGCSALGYTSADLDLLVRPCLGDRWRGRGFAVVVNRPLLTARWAGFLRPAVMGITLHELAHAVTDGYAARFADDPEGRAAQVEALRASIESTDDRAAADAAGRRAFLVSCHSPRFLRCLIHLWSRSLTAIRSAAPPLMLTFPLPFGSTDVYGYSRALMPELTSGRDRPLASILDTPAPPALQSLWIADMLPPAPEGTTAAA